MRAIEHWHAVLPAAKLGKKPLGVRVAGEEVVLFRTADGGLGALRDQCLHRRMRLSLGWVEGERLVCPYHGWSFAASGEGESARTPKMHACARRYDVVETFGVLWVRSAGSQMPFPDLGVAGYIPAGIVHRSVRVPIELLLDNHVELEHSTTTHQILGFDLKGIVEAEAEFEILDDRIHIVCRGPQRKIPGPLGRLMGLSRQETFVNDSVLRFSPPHLASVSKWFDRKTGVPTRGIDARIFVFFNPTSRTETDLLTILFVAEKHSWFTRTFVRTIGRRMAEFETMQDVRMLEGIADQRVDVDGMKLSRFDRALVAVRERLDRHYWGPEGLAGDAAPATCSPGVETGES